MRSTNIQMRYDSVGNWYLGVSKGKMGLLVLCEAYKGWMNKWSNCFFPSSPRCLMGDSNNGWEKKNEKNKNKSLHNNLWRHNKADQQKFKHLVKIFRQKNFFDMKNFGISAYKKVGWCPYFEHYLHTVFFLLSRDFFQLIEKLYLNWIIYHV